MDLYRPLWDQSLMSGTLRLLITPAESRRSVSRQGRIGAIGPKLCGSYYLFLKGRIH